MNNRVLPEDPGLCLTRPDADPNVCVGGYASRARVDVERTAIVQMGGTSIDPQPWLCVDTKCPVIIDGYIAYADTAHLSAQYVRFLAPFWAWSSGRPGCAELYAAVGLTLTVNGPRW